MLDYYSFMQGLCRELTLTLADLVGADNGGNRAEWAKLLDPEDPPDGYFSNGDCRFFRCLDRVRNERHDGTVLSFGGGSFSTLFAGISVTPKCGRMRS